MRRLLLMRDGALLEQTTPALLRERTGEHDLGRAFLRRRSRRRRGERAGDRRDRAGGCCGRSATTRARSRCCWSCRALLLVLLRYVFDDRPEVFQAIGAAAVRAVPVHRDVPGHLDHDAARAHDRHARAADDAAAGQARPARRLRDRVRRCSPRIQAAVVCPVGFGLLGLDAPHGAALVGLLAVANALLGMALGLLVSAFARTEFQAVQFMPALRSSPSCCSAACSSPATRWPRCSRRVSWALPLTYAYDALARATDPAALGAAIVLDVVVVAGGAARALGARRADAAPEDAPDHRRARRAAGGRRRPPAAPGAQPSDVRAPPRRRRAAAGRGGARRDVDGRGRRTRRFLGRRALHARARQGDARTGGPAPDAPPPARCAGHRRRRRAPGRRPARSRRRALRHRDRHP